MSNDTLNQIQAIASRTVDGTRLVSKEDVAFLLNKRGAEKTLEVVKIVERKMFEKVGDETIGGASI